MSGRTDDAEVVALSTCVEVVRKAVEEQIIVQATDSWNILVPSATDIRIAISQGDALVVTTNIRDSGPCLLRLCSIARSMAGPVIHRNRPLTTVTPNRRCRIMCYPSGFLGAADQQPTAAVTIAFPLDAEIGPICEKTASLARRLSPLLLELGTQSLPGMIQQLDLASFSEHHDELAMDDLFDILNLRQEDNMNF